MPSPLPVTDLRSLARRFAIEALTLHRGRAPEVCRGGITARIARIADGCGDELPEVEAARLALLAAERASHG